MRLTKPGAEVYAPDGAAAGAALARTTHMAIGAHQDDLEIMALEGILAGFGRPDHWFSGVVVTDGAGSARDDLYAAYTDEQMRAVRRVEQKKAAFVGEYGSAVFLDFTSAEVKDPARMEPVEDIRALVEEARPGVVYTHNLADKHPTHVSTALRVVRALRELPARSRPQRVVGCEVWRDLDWLVDEDKVVFRLDKHENIAVALVSVFDSQVVGGKRYDLATLGRRRAHATYHESHAIDVSQMVNFGMDLTPLVMDPGLSVEEYVMGYVDRFAASVRDLLARHG
ncbi:MAG: PIG-L family deacetylase [Chthonomonadales bacterium]|nr:PIG-L family deacetylase [Chthonomonadales bacterium]